MYILFACLLWSLFVLLLYRIYRYSCAVKRKNIALAQNIDREITYRFELHLAQERIYVLTAELAALTLHSSPAVLPVPIVPPELAPTPVNPNTEENQKIYEELNRIVVDHKLYLNPELSRNDLTRIIHLNKNRFAQILQQNSGYKLSDYLNNLRIGHSVLLLKSQPAYTIQAIATDSGFANMSTFYSIFKQKVGMTPSEYKSLIEQNIETE